MKRRIAWLALVLGALMFGARWRADHPTPTEKDLRIRSLLLQSSKTVVSYQLISSDNSVSNSEVVSPREETFSRKEFEMFIGCFNIAPRRNTSAFIVPLPNQKVIFNCEFDVGKSMEIGVDGIMIGIKSSDDRGWMVINYGNREERYNLHPATVKHWFKLLEANPRIGPELRKRLNQ